MIIFMNPNVFPYELEKIILNSTNLERILILTVTPNLNLKFPHCIVNLAFSKLLQSRWPEKFQVQSHDSLTNLLNYESVQYDQGVIVRETAILHSSSSKVLRTNTVNSETNLTHIFEESGFYADSTFHNLRSHVEADTDPRKLLNQYRQLYLSVELYLTSHNGNVDYA